MTIPFYCVIAVFFLIWLPRMFVIRALVRAPGGLDNNNPRDQQAKLEGAARRANAAHNNTIEAFAPFAAAVFIAHLAHANESWSTILALAFVALRVVYLPLYIADKASLRSGVWILGLGATIALMFLGALPR